MVSPLVAAKAYAAVQNQGSKPGGAANDIAPDFGQLVTNAMNDVVSTSRTAEKQMVAQTQGKADIVDVVTAVSSAQSSLETMLAVRDQVIQAYQSVMNMPI
ncbi:flagellar hook-basal body complex protein FliE [Caulobacter sp. S45]|jgi:flagellar hook-basal body complex protein FliE|uniref:flagellar hook-basal body complex protein FliE n=1 Tax=Caulobacter sp. S45 TaxID=1641861 RepID=UPI00131E4A2B|nr:flagellar hook-basal body complex protein FliE [Caulobacter sp. S45]